MSKLNDKTLMMTKRNDKKKKQSAVLSDPLASSNNKMMIRTKRAVGRSGNNNSTDSAPNFSDKEVAAIGKIDNIDCSEDDSPISDAAAKRKYKKKTQFNPKMTTKCPGKAVAASGISDRTRHSKEDSVVSEALMKCKDKRKKQLAVCNNPLSSAASFEPKMGMATRSSCQAHEEEAGGKRKISKHSGSASSSDDLSCAESSNYSSESDCSSSSSSSVSSSSTVVEMKHGGLYLRYSKKINKSLSVLDSKMKKLNFRSVERSIVFNSVVKKCRKVIVKEKQHLRRRDSRDRRSWEYMFNSWLAYGEMYPSKKNVISIKDNPKLSSWVHEQRKKFVKSLLHEDRLALLVDNGFIFQPRQHEQQSMAILVQKHKATKSVPKVDPVGAVAIAVGAPKDVELAVVPDCSGGIVPMKSDALAVSTATKTVTKRKGKGLHQGKADAATVERRILPPRTHKRAMAVDVKSTAIMSDKKKKAKKVGVGEIVVDKQGIMDVDLAHIPVQPAAGHLFQCPQLLSGEEKLNSILNSKYVIELGYDNEVAFYVDLENQDFPVCYKDFRKFKEKRFTTTSVVSGFFKLLDSQPKDSRNGQRFADCSFWSNYLSQADCSGYQVSKAFFKYFSFGSDKTLYLPMFVKGNHFILVVISFESLRIEVYDSMNDQCTVEVDRLVRSLDKFCAKKMSWDIVDNHNATNVPRQSDAYSCAYFTCWYAYQHATSGVIIPFANNQTIEGIAKAVLISLIERRLSDSLLNVETKKK